MKRYDKEFKEQALKSQMKWALKRQRSNCVLCTER